MQLSAHCREFRVHKNATTFPNNVYAVLRIPWNRAQSKDIEMKLKEAQGEGGEGGK